MKKILICSIVSLFVFTALCAGAYGANSSKGKSVSGEVDNSVEVQSQAQVMDTSVQTQSRTQSQIQDPTQNQGDDSAVMIQARQQIKATTATELKQIIQERKQEMTLELGEMKEERKEVRQNQNEVMLTVHALLASEELVGGIGPRVSEIAREFNNSVQATLLAEDKINSRSKFVKLFMGGDSESAEAIEQEVSNNRERIKNLNQLMEQCECDEEVRSTVQEQIRNVVQEQDRLEELTANEKAKKGLFGWFKNIFRFKK